MEMGRLEMAKKNIKKKIPKKTDTDYDLAVAVSDKVNLEDVRLIACRCFQSPEAGTGSHNLEIDWDVETQTNKNNKTVLVLPSFVVKGTPKNSNTKEPDLTIEADFVLIYKAKSLSRLRKNNFDAFGKTNGIYNAWPYWREYVQNIISRMGLPPLVIPVFRLMKPKSTAQKKTTKKSTNDKTISSRK